ncbi:MAG: hypothetical protein ACYC19_04425 [Acidimicrobiales bacterium]
MSSKFGLKGQRSSTRRRGLIAAAASISLVAASMGTAFLATTGTTTANVVASTASSNFLYPVGSSTSFPAAPSSLEYLSTATNAKLPSWSPNANSAGSVTTAGDLALVDATSAANGVILTTFVTNLAALQQDYSSFALPVNVYYLAQGLAAGGAPVTSTTVSASGCLTTPATCSWQPANATAHSGFNVLSSATYLTSNAGAISVTLPAGAYYDIAMDAGGSFYCTATTSSGTAALAPAFYFTAQPY